MDERIGKTKNSQEIAELGTPWGDRRQEIVVIGQNIDREAITKKFDGLLTDKEMELGPEGWMEFYDLFMNGRK